MFPKWGVKVFEGEDPDPFEVLERGRLVGRCDSIHDLARLLGMPSFVDVLFLWDAVVCNGVFTTTLEDRVVVLVRQEAG